ncbi:MAG TPA: aminoglycoside phosphotransferase [Microlunatus sp.]|nr:aminoglycoside phosphotransferase [Microlunatus sp.]
MTSNPQPPIGTNPRVAATLGELVADATDRREVRTTDAKSGARFETLWIDGQPHFLKVLSAADDWIMRVTGNTTHWEFRCWQAGLYADCPPVIDHAIVGMALEGSGPTARLSILMEDRAADLVPAGDTPIGLRQHEGFLDHMAAMHTRFLGWRDDLGLCDPAHRFCFFAPGVIAPELERADVPVPIAVAQQGWGLLPTRAPNLDALVRSVHRDPVALAEALRTTPQTFVAGDWKLGNLGRRSDGRTVLLDWAYPGEAAPCWDLTWYLSLNAARLPASKESAIAHYRSRLEAHGVDTAGWWDRQLGLSLLGMAAEFAWEKAVGGATELAWWEQAAIEGARWLE